MIGFVRIIQDYLKVKSFQLTFIIIPYGNLIIPRRNLMVGKLIIG